MLDEIASGTDPEKAITGMWSLRRLLDRDIPYIGIGFSNQVLVVRSGIGQMEVMTPREPNPLSGAIYWQ